MSESPRGNELFPSVYLTLISVLQAIALERLITQQSVLDYSFDATGLILVLQSLLALHVIFNIWISYALVVIPLRWTFDVTDFALPFLIAILEYTAIETLGRWNNLILFTVVMIGYASGWWHVSNNVHRARKQFPGPVSKDVPLARLRQPYLELATIGGLTFVLILCLPPVWINGVCICSLLLLHVSLCRSTYAWLNWWKSVSH